MEEASPEFVGKQLDCIFQDIYPDAVKIGMVSSQKIIKVIAEKLREYEAKNIVIDPVMVATSGSALMVEGAGKALVEELFPLGTVLTPNIPEAEALSQTKIRNGQDMEEAARIISSFTGGAVLVKGGHLSESADDLLYEQGKSIWLPGERVDNSNTHGTGCTGRREKPGRQRKRSQGLYYRSFESRTGPGKGKWTFKSYVCIVRN